MVIAMTRPTGRSDSSNLQFKRRTPSALLAARRGQTLCLALHGDDGANIETRVTVGPVIKVSLRTTDPAKAKLRMVSVSDQIQ